MRMQTAEIKRTLEKPAEKAGTTHASPSALAQEIAARFLEDIAREWRTHAPSPRNLGCITSE